MRRKRSNWNAFAGQTIMCLDGCSSCNTVSDWRKSRMARIVTRIIQRRIGQLTQRFGLAKQVVDLRIFVNKILEHINVLVVVVRWILVARIHLYKVVTNTIDVVVGWEIKVGWLVMFGMSHRSHLVVSGANEVGWWTWIVSTEMSKETFLGRPGPLRDSTNQIKTTLKHTKEEHEKVG